MIYTDLLSVDQIFQRHQRPIIRSKRNDQDEYRSSPDPESRGHRLRATARVLLENHLGAAGGTAQRLLFPPGWSRYRPPRGSAQTPDKMGGTASQASSRYWDGAFLFPKTGTQIYLI